MADILASGAAGAGDDCNNCDALRKMTRMWKNRKDNSLNTTRTAESSSSQPAMIGASSTSKTTGTQSTHANRKDENTWDVNELPADLEQLGRGTWTLLHTIAAYYPDKPTPEKKQQVHQFLRSLSKVFPCDDCGSDFGRALTARPPRLDSQAEFAHWMCEAHNEVNERLGKPAFPCEQVQRRWRPSFLQPAPPSAQ